MSQRHIIALSAITALGLALLPSSAVSQQKSIKDQLVGTWTLVSNDQMLPNGSKLQPFGANPKGILTFDANGRAYYIVARADLPKIGSNNRLTPTADEAKAIAEGTIAIFATYTVDEAKKTWTQRTEVSTFPNLVGTDTNFTIISLTADELTYRLEPPIGGQILQTFRRAR